MLLRRIALAAAALVPAALLAVPSASAAPAAGLPMPPANPEGFDHLTVTISDNGRFDGREATSSTYYLYCHPDGGTHPRAREACRQVDGQTTWGKDPFAPVPDGTVCTMIYGGPQRARVTGHWAGRPVRAEFKRTNGCEIERWEKFSRLLGTPEKGWPGIR
ncbi:SSI family serine proteinase inhibitor [Streptomyces roseoverticillatus]|uniref:SSI family serine proteinase inhibitor n=1 Tax=Streptomyces roseoverticillatus TaxID=66429 RepID=UPI0005BC8EC1|nr:SSI family serine proteinase inhibitor [Streptomyces roseoverticillatus]